MTQEFVTLSREVVEQIINALYCTDSQEGSPAYDFELKAVKELRAALEQMQDDQEPVAWIENVEGGIGYNLYHKAARKLPDCVRFDLYTHQPPQHKTLTDEQIEKICPSFDDPMRREMWKIGFKAAQNIK